jgi:pimeloyl-ACP methyl ester carboxylesterase
MRGYNLSSRPGDVAAYDTGQLAGDIRGLIHERGAESALLVGHDWGGTAAWYTAMNHPEVVDRLAILNAAHPRKLSQGLHHPGQLRKSWYFFCAPRRLPARRLRLRLRAKPGMSLPDHGKSWRFGGRG